jgi:hypothetical protein
MKKTSAVLPYLSALRCELVPTNGNCEVSALWEVLPVARAECTAEVEARAVKAEAALREKILRRNNADA